jgi:hypothetical protein
MKSIDELINDLEEVVRSKKKNLSKRDKELIKEVIKHLTLAEGERKSERRKEKILETLSLLLRMIGTGALKALLGGDDG